MFAETHVRADLACLCPAVYCKGSIFLGQLYAVIADDDAIEIPLVVNLDELPGVDILRYEHTIEDRDCRASGTPDRTVEADRAGVEQKFDGYVIDDAKRLPPENMRCVAHLQRAQHGADRRLAVAICANDERVLCKLRVTGRCGITEAPDVLDRDVPHRMHVLIPNLHKDAPRLSKQVAGYYQPAAEIGEVRMDAELPRVSKRPHLFGLASGILGLAILYISLAGAYLPVGAEHAYKRF